jgi:hypothetical protein
MRKGQEQMSRVPEELLTWSEEAMGRRTSREVVAAAALFRRFEGGAGIFFLGRNVDGLTTTASS